MGTAVRCKPPTSMMYLSIAKIFEKNPLYQNLPDNLKLGGNQNN
jgi:hypothetical protein